ncbi:MAG TPA: Ig-like domain-containing protein [Spirochaetota bacterium]|mgnify:CR=1 FL=1|nr:Ig-like domain-containing protein [Spirochaetota bacterium]
MYKICENCILFFGFLTLTFAGCSNDSSSKSPIPQIVVTGISLDKTVLNIEKTLTYQMTATITPSNATNENVTWTSSDNNIVTISSSGLIAAINEGVTTVSVKTDDGGFTDTCTVTVTNTYSIKEFSPEKLYVEVDGGALPSSLIVKLSRIAETNKTISISCSDPTQLTVPSTITILSGSDSGIVPLTGIVAGSSTIVVNASIDSSSCDVHVLVYDDSLVRGVQSLSPDTGTVKIGNTLQMQVELDMPAPSGGSIVSVSSSGYGTVPSSITIPAGQMSATFNFTGSSQGIATVNSTLGSTSKNASITVEP